VEVDQLQLPKLAAVAAVEEESLNALLHLM
jgi:hypothetical protein